MRHEVDGFYATVVGGEVVQVGTALGEGTGTGHSLREERLPLHLSVGGVCVGGRRGREPVAGVKVVPRGMLCDGAP